MESTAGPNTWLPSRHTEYGALDRLIDHARAGTSEVLVIQGEAGMGKTTLLDYLATHASQWHVTRAAGIESEMELAFAGLQQLSAPFLDRIDRLPAPQSDPGLIYFNEVDEGGHFAAWEQPQLFCEEIRNAFRSLR